MEQAVDVWERARRGRHTVVLGQPLPAAPQDLRVLRVSCDVPLTTLGPLLEARDRVERILGTTAPFVEMARAKVLTGLRRHLLGDLTSVAEGGSLVDVFNRFAALGPCALVLDAAESADAASLDMLRHILSRPGWLRLPLLITMRTEPREGSAAALVEAIRAAYGEEGVLRPPAPEAALASSRGPSSPAQPPPLELRALPADVLRVLRALAIAGSGCEAHVLAAVLEISEMSVLDALQRAADLGVGVEDRGEGRFHLSGATVELLRASVLPSVAAALHRRVASILAQETAAQPEALPTIELSEADVRPGNAWDVMAAEPPHTLRLPRADAPPPTVTLADSDAAQTASDRDREARQAADREAEEAAARAREAQEIAEREARENAEREAAERQARENAERQARENAERQAREAAEREAREAAEQAAREARLAAALSAEQAAARAAEEAPDRAIEAAIARAALEAEAHAAREAATFTADPPDEEGDRATDLAEEEAAARAAEEAAAHAVEEARHAFAARAEEEAEDRRAAAEAAHDAVAGAQQELAEERLARPMFTKPFAGETRPSRQRGQGNFGAPRTDAAKRPAPSAAAPDAPSRPRPARVEDDARAARHLAAAGDSAAAVERYFEAMLRAAAAAAYPQAVAHAHAALALLDRLPQTDARRAQRAQILLEAGRVLWHGAGPDDSFTLQGALRVLEAARASVHAGDAPALIAEVAVTIAGVLYDIGDVKSLSRALDELANASRTLADSGNPQAAARLFNDQAGVYIRLGDPVRAAHLLTESRKIFEPAAKTDPIAAIEMAETDHLFARILLLVPARPGRESDALTLGLDHAIAAERTFRRLGAPREVGRVLETMGRIELRKGRLDRAAERLTAAVQIQESVGDVVGLAQSTSALADVLFAGGQPREAANLLADSVVLHFEKGSPLGLAENRRTLAALANDPKVRAELGPLLHAIEEKLMVAEGVLGRILPSGAPSNEA